MRGIYRDMLSDGRRELSFPDLLQILFLFALTGFNFN